MRIKNLCYLTVILFGFQLLISSCANTRKSIYFVDQRDTIIKSGNEGPITFIQPNDILSIVVSSLNENATQIFNTPNSSKGATSTSAGTLSQSTGYLVNRSGFIQFPVLGDIKVSGLTTDQLRQELTRQLVSKKLLVDPIIVVRQLNFKISVLGEVAHPAVLNIPSEKVSLLEALGLAGDITVFGRKDNVMVIREENGEKKIRHLDLNSSELFASQYYYLKSNDVVYVEANKAKVANSGRSSQILPVVFGALSLIAIVVGEIVRR